MNQKSLTYKQAKKILIAITTRGTDLNIGLVLWLLKLNATYPEITLGFFQGRLCAYQSQFELHRYMLTKEARKYTHVLMIDSDVIPHPYILELLYNAKKDICCAPVWHGDHLSQLGWNIHLNIHPKNTWERLLDKEGKKGLEKIDHCSMASTLVKAKIFRAFIDEPLYSSKNMAPHMHMAPSDVIFTNRIKKKGFEIWVNWDVKGTVHLQKIGLCDALIKQLKTVKIFTVPKWDVPE